MLDRALYKLLSLLPVLLDQEKFHFYELMLASKELLLHPLSALDILYSRDYSKKQKYFFMEHDGSKTIHNNMNYNVSNHNTVNQTLEHFLRSHNHLVHVFCYF